MNNFQRGIYRPADVPIDCLAVKDLEEERSRAPLLVVIALVMLAPGLVWLAYTQDLSQGISAPEEEVSVPLSEAGPAPIGLNAHNNSVSPAPVAQAGQPPQAGPSRALSRTAVLQLGAFESQELANVAWAAFHARYAVAANWVPDVQRADLGAKGVVYRLRVGRFADRTSATDACVQLRAVGANCFVLLQRQGD